ncbi:diguanylate cyclase [Cellulomonas sp. SLBN-39]|uniref:GGDEF domain-containing protein n=1 Tax=Cellulomonas sp. SLBN-39 TaxID=2768446 RepID=UPI001154A5A5|nr:GGDEF domain-containing protein [Cellulomonas sp. SLBN-39]TQL03102.1 diguanylate cyclase (GGDEF)-like protein [Cellulomonas sp. SLBN-39]
MTVDVLFAVGRGEDLTVLARRVLALGIVVCVPALVTVWVVEQAHDPWVRWGYPVLLVHLATLTWILLRRPRWVSAAILGTLAVLETWWIVVAVARVAAAPDPVTAWAELFPMPLLGTGIVLVVAFLFQRTRAALVHGGMLVATTTLALVLAFSTFPDGAEQVGWSVRFGVYLGVQLFLLLILSRAKEHVVTARADAERAARAALRMRDMAYLDDLTGIANRRRLLEELRHQAGLVGPSHPVSVVYFDLDHFKRLNDDHGHDVGDQALRAVADVASRAVRDDDLLARVGGEEFVVVAPGADRARAVQLAERLRQTVPHELGMTVGTVVTASFGVTELLPDEAPEDVLRRVDALMYRAKGEGRDRVRSELPR